MESIWATLLAKALEGKNVKELLSNVGAGGAAPAVGGATSAAAGGAAPEATKEEEKKEEEKEESDDDMVSFIPTAVRILDLSRFIGLRTLRLNVVYIYCRFLVSCLFSASHAFGSRRPFHAQHITMYPLLHYLQYDRWSLPCLCILPFGSVFACMNGLSCFVHCRLLT